MQAVSGERMAIELARSGGLSFIYVSQPIDSQAEMVKRVKSYKAGFVVSDSNLTPEHTLADVLALTAKTGHSTIAITDDGSPSGEAFGDRHQSGLPERPYPGRDESERVYDPLCRNGLREGRAPPYPKPMI